MHDMKTTVAVLGPGAVGGTFAVQFLIADYRTICVAPPATVQLMGFSGISLETSGSPPHVGRPVVTEHLSVPVELLLVSVRPDQLQDAIERVDSAVVAEGVVLPLLNGLEHMDALRERFPGRVAAGALSRFDAYRVGRMQIVRKTPMALVTMGSDELSRQELERAGHILERAGIDVEIDDDERRILWRKAVRLAVLAPATVITGRTVGALRSDYEWRSRMEEAVAEACAVAAADGVSLMPSAQWTRITEMDTDVTTSVARDVRNGSRAREIDAITGAVLRAGERLGVPCPVLSELASQASLF
jgi:2-dehydropantoate 2-reductase